MSNQPGRRGSRRRSSTALRSSRRSASWALPLAVVAVVVFAAVVSGGLYLSHQPSDVRIPPNATATGVLVGQPDAPVTIDIYVDFQCPACQRFEQRFGSTIEQLIESGEAKVVHHPVAYLDEASSTNYSSRASTAAACVAAVGVFPRYLELLFDNQPPEGGDGLSTERLIELGREAGATGEQFAGCVHEQRYAGWTDNVTEEASQRGVTGTPTVLVNGKPLQHRTPEALRQAVQQAA